MELKSTIDWKYIWGSVSTFFSLLFLLFSPLWSWILVGSVITTIALFAGVVFCLFFIDKDWGKSGLYFLIPLFLLSFIASILSGVSKNKSTAEELIADATESILDDLLLSGESTETWLINALNSNSLIAFLAPAKYDEMAVIDEIRDTNALKKKALDLFRENGSIHNTGSSQLTIQLSSEVCFINATYKGQLIEAKYNVGYANNQYLRHSWKKDDYVLLPESSFLVLKGLKLIGDSKFEESKQYLCRSDSLGNPVGSYYLARWFVTGYDNPPDSLKYFELLEKAAINGCRAARYEWSNYIIKNSHSTMVDKARAEVFLKATSEIGAIATKIILNHSHDAIKLLHYYYHETGQNIKAYYWTKRFIRRLSPSPIKYSEHLMNCLALPIPFYREAKKIISEGENLNPPEPNCYYVHGYMFLNGLGEKKSYERAEEFFHFTADSLHYSKGFLGLAELCKETGRPGYDYWKMLYDVDFNEKILE